MPVISIFSGTFCRGDEVTASLQETTGYPLFSDQDIINRASQLSAIAPERLFRCLSSSASAFNPFTRELERSISWLRLAVAERLQEDNFILHGFTGHLIPNSISHALHVCLIAEKPYRIQACRAFYNISPEEAEKRLAGEEALKSAWVKLLRGVEHPWHSSLYDILLPTHTLSTGKMLTFIQKGIKAAALRPSDTSRQAADKYLEEARIEATLAEKGHAVRVKTENGHIVLTIDRTVMMLERLEQELISIVKTIAPESRITVNVEPDPDKIEAYRQYNRDIPSRVLLVDDEREFVQTLSERLEMRDIGSAVAYDGESALELLETDEPDVILLDLQMPGINGIEVLKTVKETRPDIEVIILTGHGRQADRDLCMKMGAFAYLEKPVDIDTLSRTLIRANNKLRQNKRRGA